MINREKVIKGLTHHKLCMCDMSGKICPYWNEDDGCSKKMLEDAIALLKEQEESIPVSWLKEKLEGHPELPYAVTDGINNVLDLWKGR